MMAKSSGFSKSATSSTSSSCVIPYSIAQLVNIKNRKFIAYELVRGGKGETQVLVAVGR